MQRYTRLETLKPRKMGCLRLGAIVEYSKFWQNAHLAMNTSQLTCL